MALTLYNTRTRAREPFRTLEPGHARIYVCGLTPSAEGHLGHARSFLFFDILRRYLEHPRNGYRVTFVKNVTDVDDRSIATAKAEGTTFDRVVERFYSSFRESMRILGVREPDEEPYATAFVPQIVAMIGELIDGGFAYVSEDGIYYDVAKFPRYGALSGRNVDELLVGARIAENEHKRDPLDFALWKFAKPGEPQWESPWGGGRPGWHIECSAMSRALLGVPFDLHGGGYDLIFPHHENEIAQSEALMDAPPMAVQWVHGGLLNFEGRKMSKSLGNFEPLSALLRRHDPMAIRLLFLQTGYQKPMNFTEQSIGSGKTGLERLQKAAFRLRAAGGTAAGAPQEHPAAAELFAALDDDMDTSSALSVLFKIAGGASTAAERGDAANALAFLRDAAGILGLGPAFDDAVLDRLDEGAQTRSTLAALDAGFVDRLAARVGDAVHLNGHAPEAAIAAVIEARLAARKNKNFALSDKLRDALAAEGIALKDSKDGTTWTAAG